MCATLYTKLKVEADGSRFCELDGIGKKVDNYLPESPGITLQVRESIIDGLDVFQPFPLQQVHERSNSLFYNSSWRKRFSVEGQFAGSEVRVIDNIVDDVQKAVGRGQDAVEVLLLLFARM